MSNPDVSLSISTIPSSWIAESRGDAENQRVDGYIDVDYLENENHGLRTLAGNLQEDNESLSNQIITMSQQIYALTAQVSAITLEKDKQAATFNLLKAINGDKYNDKWVQGIIEANFEISGENDHLKKQVEAMKGRIAALEKDNLAWVKEKTKIQVEWWMLRDKILENEVLKAQNEELKREVGRLQLAEARGKKRQRRDTGEDNDDGNAAIFGVQSL